jgi:hypothetical protein
MNSIFLNNRETWSAFVMVFRSTKPRSAMRAWPLFLISTFDIDAPEECCVEMIRKTVAIPRTRWAISEMQLLARIAQSEQMRVFFIEMWLQNPSMARQAATRVQGILLHAVTPAPTFIGAHHTGEKIGVS